MNNITLSDAAKLFVGKRNIALLCHVHPDGDTIGSAYALKYALEALGNHNVTVMCNDEVPRRLAFLTGGETDISTEKLRDFKADLICSVDCADIYRIGDSVGFEVDFKIDHHKDKDGSDFAKFNYTDELSASTGEIMLLLINELEKIGEGRLTKKTATSLYAAIASDTGCFKYSNVTAETMRAAAYLIEMGADYADACYRLFSIKTAGQIKAQRIMLDNFVSYQNGRVAFLLVTNEMRDGLSNDDFGEISSLLREIEGVELAVVVKQDDVNLSKYKISMRSGENISASELCSLFGGGGHERAAGAIIEADSPENAEKTVLERILAVLDKNG